MSSGVPKDTNSVSQWSPLAPQLSTGLESAVDSGSNATTLINQQGWGEYSGQETQVAPCTKVHSGYSNMTSTDCFENMGQKKLALDPKQTQQTNSTLFQGISSVNQGQTFQIGQIQADKANGLLNPMINNELNRQSILYRNMQQVNNYSLHIYLFKVINTFYILCNYIKHAVNSPARAPLENYWANIRAA